MNNSTPKILLLVALPAELGEEAATTLGRSCDICYVGIGKLSAFEATSTALQQADYDIVINAGTTGSFRHPFASVLHPSRIAQGDAFIGSDFATEEIALGTGDNDTAILSGDNFIGEDTPEAFRQLISAYDCMDMESYAIARAIKYHSAINNISEPELHLIKVVSDGADGSIGDWAARLRHLRPTLLAAIEDLISTIKHES